MDKIEIREIYNTVDFLYQHILAAPQPDLPHP
jgi:hypothetical protein